MRAATTQIPDDVMQTANVAPMAGLAALSVGSCRDQRWTGTE